MVRSNKICTLIIAMLSLLLLAVPSLIEAGPPMKQHPPRIRLGATEFTPSKGERPTIPSGLAVSGYPEGQSGYYIIQFAGPIQQSWKEQVTETGAEMLDYIPDFAFKVRMNPAEARRVEELESVIWVGFYHPAYKLSPDLKRNGTQIYTVRLERGSDAGPARVAIAKNGARVLAHKDNMLKVAADSAQLEAIARVLDVAWVQNFIMWEKHNEYAAGAILGGSTASDNGYDGSTQIIGIADTGLGGGTRETAHLNLPPSSINEIRNWTGAHPAMCLDFFCYCTEEIVNNGAQDVDTGHGTHTTLSALGRGTGSGEEQGTAPAAQLIFQAVEDFVDYGDYCDLFFDNLYDGYYLTGIANNIANLFEEAYNQGARIHSNSWGWNAKGYYDVNSKNADQFIWDHQYMTITYSAGNSGIDVNKDGVIDSDSIGSPGTAKNVITVGASENERSDNYPCDDSVFPGCNNEPLFTYGQAWPKDFPANPIKDDPSGGNPEQMAAFSSRGETDDGRIKPDLVAPGTWVLSGYSDMYQQGYDPSRNPQNKAWQYDGWGLPYNSFYKYMGGTSMASPLTAGGAAVVRDFYEKTDGHDASAALVKATLINSAHDLLDENNDGVDDNDLPIPNVHEGWGRVDLANATDGSHQYVDDTSGLFTEGGQQPGSSTHYYSVVSTGPFKVTLVWSDYPSATGVSKNLVNDLDLKVTSPQGTIYRGNFFSGGWSVTGGTEDRTNNVENVYVEFPEPGTWTVEVKGYNVVYGPQPFALVVDGADFNKTPIASFSANPTSGPYPLTVLFDASDSSDPDGAIVRHDWDFGDGGTATVADPIHEYQTAGEYNATLTVTDDDGATGSASKTITVTAPANITHIGNLTATSKAFRSLWRMKVTVRVHDTDHDPVANATVLYTWSDTPNTIRNDCVTKSDGTCTVSGWQFRGTCLTFEVKDILHSSLDYEAAANDVPDDITDCR